MYQLVESIKIDNSEPQNLKWHQERYERSYRSLFGKIPALKLGEEVKVPAAYRKGIVKCRLLYNSESFAVEFEIYKPPSIKSLKLVEDNRIEYTFKYNDRTSINELLKSKEDCDDILIVKSNRVTDSSIANIVLFDGEKWFTPAHPLLQGTAREKLLHEQKIIPLDILKDDLKNFSHYKLINAMLDFGAEEMRDISSIK